MPVMDNKFNVTAVTLFALDNVTTQSNTHVWLMPMVDNISAM